MVLPLCRFQTKPNLIMCQEVDERTMLQMISGLNLKRVIHFGKPYCGVIAKVMKVNCLQYQWQVYSATERLLRT